MTISRKERCPSCGSLGVIKWGRRNGHQRYKCQDCIRTFTFRRKDVSSKNRFVWFRWWVLRKQTLSEISSLSGYSERQLSRWFDVYLEKYPRWEIQRRERVNLLIDGTWFPNKLCLVVYRDESVKATLLYRITDEELEKEICEDLENIRSLGIEVESVTTDGGSGIIKAVRKVFPQAVRQRCLAHIQRECLTWLTRNPRSEAGLELRHIAMTISAIKQIMTGYTGAACSETGMSAIRSISMPGQQVKFLISNGIPTKWCGKHIYISDVHFPICSVSWKIQEYLRQQTLSNHFSGILKKTYQFTGAFLSGTIRTI